MENRYYAVIAGELGVSEKQVRATSLLLDDGATVPFISRYRKEVTGSLDEVAVAAVRDRMTALRELDARRDAVLKSLTDNGHLTDELNARVVAAQTMQVLEDIYLPYRPKRRTKATIAKEKGLGPLAELVFAQGDIDPEAEAALYIDPERGVADTAAALAGARDIIAEMVSEDQGARERVRGLFMARSTFRSKVLSGKEEEGAKFKDYFDWEEPAAKAPSHRILAMRRGENEGVLSFRVSPPEEDALGILESMFVKGAGPASEQVLLAVRDGYKRLLSMSMETETRLVTKKRADADAIAVFADNVRELLLYPPLGQKNVMAVDPGFRTGCKVVCLDRQGKLLHNDTIYPHLSDRAKSEAATKTLELCRRFDIEAIAVGNGTAGRETETFIRGLGLSSGINVVMVNESGASIYSASDVARQEFPDYDVTVRGSVSIGRRLMDPLAELVKIDPKSIGVGQYQHDVDQNELRKSLDDVVMSCVNGVGVEANTASRELLTYVSGLGPQLAKNIVEYRDTNGPFGSREELKKVPRLGPKAFEQAAGFLRVRGGKNPLDSSAVHPESYKVVEAMAADMGCTVEDLITKESIRRSIVAEKYVTDTVGLPTLKDILAELARPGRDPRGRFEAFSFADGVEKVTDLTPGMRLPGVVTNVTAFGAFVDVGVHQDGLVHISQLADKFVKNPADVVKVHQRVTVTVLDVDTKRNRISLSMKSVAGDAAGGR